MTPKPAQKRTSQFKKNFHNGKKVPLIPQLFINNYIINNKLEPDFKLKANFFNKFFADNCTLIQNNSVILNFIERESMNRLTSVVFNDESILKIVRALDVNKAHSHEIYQFE